MVEKKRETEFLITGKNTAPNFASLNKIYFEEVKKAKKQREPMSIAAQLTPTSLDVVIQALHTAYRSAQNNFNRAYEFKKQQGANWTDEEQEVLESFRSHVTVVITAAKELGIELNV